MVDSTTLRNFSGTMATPLRRGDAGVEQTIDLIRHLIDDAVKDPVVNRTAIDALKAVNAPSFDRDAKLRALYAFAQWPNFLYVEDPVGPFGPKETVRPVRDLLQLRAGDCDDFTVLLASLAGTIGIPTRAVTIAGDRSAPSEFSHIYPEAEVAPGRWVPLDAARPGAAYGVGAPAYFRKRIWSLTDSTFRDVSGRGVSGQLASSLNGYAMLGDVAPNVAAEDISAVGQSVANIVSASKGNPYGSFQTPYTPFAPAAGYGIPGYPGGPTGASVSLAGNSALWWILGIAAVGYAITSARGR
jgi:transglutaminase-like putative cysteine protease